MYVGRGKVVEKVWMYMYTLVDDEKDDNTVVINVV